MNVNKVAGNFHIAHGESLVRDGRHIHQFIPEEAPSYNISHTIHSITFGKAYPSQGKNSYINTHTHTHSLTYAYTNTKHTHTHTHTHSLSHTHTHTHTHTHRKESA